MFSFLLALMSLIVTGISIDSAENRQRIDERRLPLTVNDDGNKCAELWAL